MDETSGRLEVLGGDFDEALLLDGKPLALAWPDQQGSVAQYLIRTGGADLRESFRSAQALLERGLLPSVPLVASAGPFLAMVAPGEYSIVFEPGASGDYHPLDAVSAHPGAHSHFYPLYWDLEHRTA